MINEPPDLPLATCATCVFYGARVVADPLRRAVEVQQEEGSNGECRRYPPRLVPPYGRARFPPTLPEQWCGEHPDRAPKILEVVPADDDV